MTHDSHTAPANCDHPSMSGVDTTPSDDPEKVWECHSCGRLYRYEKVSPHVERRVLVSE